METEDVETEDVETGDVGREVERRRKMNCPRRVMSGEEFIYGDIGI